MKEKTFKNELKMMDYFNGSSKSIKINKIIVYYEEE